MAQNRADDQLSNNIILERKFWFALSVVLKTNINENIYFLLDGMRTNINENIYFSIGVMVICTSNFHTKS